MESLLCLWRIARCCYRQYGLEDNELTDIVIGCGSAEASIKLWDFVLYKPLAVFLLQLSLLATTTHSVHSIEVPFFPSLSRGKFDI